MKPRRRNRRPGNRPMTPAQVEMVSTAKITACIPCLVWAEAGNMPLSDVVRYCDWNHCKSGNVRRGHDDGYASCLWHHRGVAPDLVSKEIQRAKYGPSLMDGSRLFRECYGSDDELIQKQREVLGRPNELHG